MIYTSHQISFDQIKKNEMGRARSKCEGEEYIRFWWGNLSEGDDLQDLGIDSILKWILKSGLNGGWAWTGLTWLRTVTGGGLL